MRRFSVVGLFVFLTLSLSAVHADKIDPSMQEVDPSCATSATGNCFTIVGNLFTFSADSSGGGVFGFRNGNNYTVFSILIQQSLFNASQITCDPGQGTDPNNGSPYDFLSCVVLDDPTTGITSIYFSNPANPPGIPPRGEFYLDLDPPSSGIGFWASNQSFNGFLNTPPPSSVPEPATVILISAGSLLGWWRRKR